MILQPHVLNYWRNYDPRKVRDGTSECPPAMRRLLNPVKPYPVTARCLRAAPPVNSTMVFRANMGGSLSALQRPTLPRTSCRLAP